MVEQEDIEHNNAERQRIEVVAAVANRDLDTGNVDEILYMDGIESSSDEEIKMEEIVNEEDYQLEFEEELQLAQDAMMRNSRRSHSQRQT